ncbi:MAG TPA: inositol monophosphatase family protein, partial [Thermoplasmataceae archaeon]|nr:inositol monophosphatase family protein [Thermoplasmataceae archaeon]
MDPVFRIFEDIGRSIIDSVKSLNLKEDRSRITGMGADGTNTHFIDKIAEDILMEQVKSGDLPYNIISEEIGLVDRGYGENLIVDPVDGTYNAINGIPFYSVSIAIGKEDTDSVSRGFVMNLGNGDVFIAEKGKGAFLNGRKISVCSRPKNVYGLNLTKG